MEIRYFMENKENFVVIIVLKIERYWKGLVLGYRVDNYVNRFCVYGFLYREIIGFFL